MAEPIQQTLTECQNTVSTFRSPVQSSRAASNGQQQTREGSDAARYLGCQKMDRCTYFECSKQSCGIVYLGNNAVNVERELALAAVLFTLGSWVREKARRGKEQGEGLLYIGEKRGRYVGKGWPHVIPAKGGVKSRSCVLGSSRQPPARAIIYNGKDRKSSAFSGRKYQR